MDARTPSLERIPAGLAFDRRVDPTILRINTPHIATVELLYQALQQWLMDDGLADAHRVQADSDTPVRPSRRFVLAFAGDAATVAGAVVGAESSRLPRHTSMHCSVTPPKGPMAQAQRGAGQDVSLKNTPQGVSIPAGKHRPFS